MNNYKKTLTRCFSNKGHGLQTSHVFGLHKPIQAYLKLCTTLGQADPWQVTGSWKGRTSGTITGQLKCRTFLLVGGWSMKSGDVSKSSFINLLDTLLGRVSTVICGKPALLRCLVASSCALSSSGSMVLSSESSCGPSGGYNKLNFWNMILHSSISPRSPPKREMWIHFKNEPFLLTHQALMGSRIATVNLGNFGFRSSWGLCC